MLKTKHIVVFQSRLQKSLLFFDRNEGLNIKTRHIGQREVVNHGNEVSGKNDFSPFIINYGHQQATGMAVFYLEVYSLAKTAFLMNKIKLSIFI